MINTQHNYKYNIVGEVSIFIKNDLIYNKIDTLCMSNNGLLNILIISLNINNKIVLIRGIYKSPKADIIDFSDFIYNNFNDI